MYISQLMKNLENETTILTHSRKSQFEILFISPFKWENLTYYTIHIYIKRSKCFFIMEREEQNRKWNLFHNLQLL
jgi:hypothetical protein